MLLLAQSTLYLPKSPSTQSVERSKKQKLKTDILEWLKRNDLGWQSGCLEAGTNFVNGLTDCLWYIDGQHSTLGERPCHIPPDLQHFQGYNKPEKSNHRKRTLENLSVGILDHHCTILNSFLLQSWMQSGKWKAFRSVVCSLADSLAKYCSYLKEKNCDVQQNHASPSVVRSRPGSYCVIKRARWVKPTFAAQYRNLQVHLDAVKEFEPILVNDFAPGDTRYVCTCVCMYVCLYVCMYDNVCMYVS